MQSRFVCYNPFTIGSAKGLTARTSRPPSRFWLILNRLQRLPLIPSLLVVRSPVEAGSVARRSTIRALVIGASGHLGNAVVREFLHKNCRITACGRRSVPPANLDDLPVRYLSGDTGTSG